MGEAFGFAGGRAGGRAGGFVGGSAGGSDGGSVGDFAGDGASGGASGGAGRASGEGSGPLPPTPRWRRAVLAAPGLALLGVLLLVGAALVEDRHGKRAAALCHQLPLPWTLFALAYAALACGVAAPALCWRLFRTAAREGRRGVESWQGTLALCICVANTLALLFEAVTVYVVGAEAGEPYWHCSGSSPLAGLHILMQSHVL